MRKVCLAYSGGLDTSVIIRWLIEKYDADVVTVTVDVGQKDDLSGIEKKARAIGATKHYSIDAKNEFVKNYIFPSIKANALYEGKYPLSAALARPLIAEKLVDIANVEDAYAVAHGCTGKGNDQVRFEVAIKAASPKLKIIAPVREWKLSRDNEIEYAKRNNIPLPDYQGKYSVDENLWGRAIECGDLDHPELEPPNDVFEWTVAPEKSPSEASYVTLGFEEGIPVSVNGRTLDGVELIEYLNNEAGRHGVGRIDHMEDRLIGIKSREVYECPAALCFLEAHKDLEKLVLTRHEIMFKQMVDTQWTWLAYAGLWPDPLREDLEAFIDETQKRVIGEVTLKLFKGNVRVVGRRSSQSLYNADLATYDIDSTFDQSQAVGFVELWGLPTRIANWLKSVKKGN
ncbi:MAG: argininosuccinate synthase [Candidatus Bathyarchaeia archaeon]